jgi:biopolymer transport protein ExbD
MVVTRRRSRKVGAFIFTASMADIVLLLIVFFVLTYRVDLDPTPVTLPTSVVRAEVPEDAALISISAPQAGSEVRVSTGAERALRVRSDEEIATFAANVVAQERQRPFVVKADRGVRYERIDTVLQALRDAEAETVYLLSDQKTMDE